MIAGITVGAVLFLILVGALVRMTGSGMGCPDWPTCFGKWIPPTDISELPADYKTRFQVAGKEIADFDAFKTWVEYINRLIGVLIGFCAILSFLAAYPIRNQNRRLFVLSALGLFLVVLQGGIGAVVVRTNLDVSLISLHMFMALLILGIYLSAWLQASKMHFLPKMEKIAISKVDMAWAIVAMVVLTVQIFLGTQVREGVDEMAISMGEAQRDSWLAAIGKIYTVHSYFYYVIIGALAVLAYRLRSALRQNSVLKRFGLSIGLIVVLEILFGLSMHHFAIPPSLQPLHLLFASILLMQIWALNWIFVQLRQDRQKENTFNTTLSYTGSHL